MDTGSVVHPCAVSQLGVRADWAFRTARGCGVRNIGLRIRQWLNWVDGLHEEVRHVA